MSFTTEIENYLYEEYLEIGADAFQDKVRYFEANEKRILNLPFIICIEIQCDYINALHETDKHFRVLKIIDELIATIISENVYEIKGKDVYKELLFIKADSYYNTVDFYNAKHVISELIKIDGENVKNKSVFIRNNVDKLRYDSQKIKGISILLFFLSAIVIAFEIIVIRVFYLDWINIFANIRNGLFALGFLTLIGKEIKIKIQSEREYQELLKS